jgi:hypothetical protein
MTTRDEYVSRLKGQLDRWNADMGKWEAQARGAQAEARKRYEEQLVALREQREKALYNLKLLEGASNAAWSDFTRGADEAWERMRAAIDKARTHFEKR